MKQTLRYLGGLALAALLLWLVLRNTDPEVLWSQLQEASLPGLLLAAGLLLCQALFRAWRWRALLEPVKKELPLRSLLTAVVVGYAVSFTVPGRLGEAIRPALVSARERVRFGPCLGSVVADRFLDVSVVLVAFALGALTTPLEGAAAELVTGIRASSLMVLLLVGLPSILLLGLSRRRSRLDDWLRQRRGRLAFMSRWILTLSQGMEALLRPRLAARVVAHSVLTWLMIYVGTWVGVNAAGAPVSLREILVIMPILVLGIALPTPGGVGGYHAAMTLGLTRLFGIDHELAVTVSVLVHLAGVLPMTVAGALALALDRGLLADFRALAARGVALRSSPEAPATEGSAGDPST